MKAAVCIAITLWVLLYAGAAAAAQRYATPGGSGPSPCVKAHPCSLKVAIEEAGSGDEVIVGAGTYSLGLTTIGAPMTVNNLNIHGDPAGAMPRIVAASSATTLTFGGTGIHVSYLEFENQSSLAPRGITCDREGVLERVRATAVGPEAIGVLQIADCLVRDSVIRAEGMEEAALAASGTASTGTVRNVTAIATGELSTGIRSSYLGPPASPYTLDVGNTIARGAASDLRAEAGLPGAGNIVVSHSNFGHVERVGEATISDAGDYREAAGSPTIDAGIADRSGPLDLAGNPRVLGSAPDIGAFEFVPAGGGGEGTRGGVRSLSIKPRRFGAWPRGGPVAPAILKSKPPKGAEVTYAMTGPATVTFSVSRKVRGRLAGKRCVRKTGANAAHRKCSFYVPVKGSFTQQGADGSNHFVFSGRIAGKALRPGAYKLTAFAGHLVSAPFEIGGLRRHRGRG